MSKNKLQALWLIVPIFALVLLLSTGSRNSFGVFIKYLADDFSWNRTSVASISTVYMIFYALSQPLSGWLIDHFNPKTVITSALVIVGLSFVALNWSHGLWYFYLFYGAIAGMASSAISAAPISVIINNLFQERSGRMMGLTISGMAAGQIVPSLIIFLLISVGWRTTYLIYGLSFLLLGIVTIVLLGANFSAENKQPNSRHQVPSLTFLEALKTVTFKQIGASYFVCGFTVNLIAVHLASHILGNGFSETTASLSLAMVGIGSIVGANVVGYFSDFMSNSKLMSYCFIIRGIGFLLILFGQSPWLLVLGGISLGLGWVATVTLVTKLCEQNFGKANLGTTVGGLTMVHHLASALAALIGGWLFDLSASYLTTLILGAALCFLAAFNSYFIRPVISQKQQDLTSVNI